MTTALIIAAVLWVGIGVGIGVAIAWSAAHDKTWEDERPEWADDPTLAAHPAASRIRDLIAANEAARLDAEWEAMNR